MSFQPGYVFETTDYEGTPVVLSRATWHAKAGNDTLDGKAGIDTAQYSVARAQASWTTVGDVTTVTSSEGGWDGIAPSLNNEDVFLRISFFTSRSGGTCPLRSLIFRCDCADTA